MRRPTRDDACCWPRCRADGAVRYRPTETGTRETWYCMNHFEQLLAERDAAREKARARRERLLAEKGAVA
jgi:hypothetical protein